ncbi:hypothetical protein DFH09DRAFT_1303981 [Mycena vulgaris]|nr:hypothetical protein DFH09DRAFT_1303981 [Mycena vulgaris]
MSLLLRLSRRAKFSLQLVASNPFALDDSISMKPVTFETLGLDIEASGSFSFSNVEPTIAKIIDGLTLPALLQLKLGWKQSPRVLLTWRHAQFLPLSARSSFHTHLLALQLFHCVSTEDDLLAFVNGNPHPPLVTNSLLAWLTLALENPSPVPRLCIFRCRSLLQFDNHVLLNFLLSRVQERRLFTSGLSWLPDHHRQLNPIVVSRLRELYLQKTLLFSFSAANT